MKILGGGSSCRKQIQPGSKITGYWFMHSCTCKHNKSEKMFLLVFGMVKIIPQEIITYRPMMQDYIHNWYKFDVGWKRCFICKHNSAGCNTAIGRCFTIQNTIASYNTAVDQRCTQIQTLLVKIMQ